MLTDAMLVLLLAFCGASAFDYIPTFRFANQPRIFRTDEEVCQLCFGSFECFAMDKARCDFNNEMAAILIEAGEDEIQTTSDEAMKTEIDTKLYDLMIEESLQENYRECIPLVSSYTNCHRETLCSGCTTCSCDMKGNWNCSIVQRYKPDILAIDHRVLVSVMENLKAAIEGRRNKYPDNTRYKRSAVDRDKIRTDKYKYEEISEWMYGKDALIKQGNKTTVKPLANLTEGTTGEHKVSRTTKLSTSNTFVTEETPVYLAFDEVLSEITSHGNKATTINYEFLEGEANESRSTGQFLQMLAEEEQGNDVEPMYKETNTYKDLQIDSNNLVLDAENAMKIDVNVNLDKQPLEHTNDDINKEMDMGMGFLNIANVMKRDVSKVKVATIAPNTITTIKPIFSKNNTILHISNKEKALQDILNPLNNIINDNNKETVQLINIKEKLAKFMNYYSVNSTSQFESQFVNNDSFNTLKLDDNIQFNNIRRKFGYDNTLALEKYYMKLKKDVNEVVRDIVVIHNNMVSRTLPNDLKLLLQAIKYFLKKNKSLLRVQNNTNSEVYTKNIQNGRRVFNTNTMDIKEAILRILEVVDKDMPTANAFSPLSRKTKKILRRVIKNIYVDDFPSNGIKLTGLISNLSNDLNSIGGKWQERVKNVITSSATERLYNLQLLYLTFAQDIEKLMNALASLDFVHTRRMTGIEENVGIGILNHINSSLIAVNNEVMHYIINDNKEKTMKKIVKGKIRKESLLKKIKSLLTNSKNDFINLLHNKETDTEIIKKETQIKRDEAKQKKYLEIMQKWQNNPYLSSAKEKRSIREYTKPNNRMKNIIPRYLRGKVNPALSAKGPQEINKASSKIIGNISTTTVKSKRTTVRLNKMKRRHIKKN